CAASSIIWATGCCWRTMTACRATASGSARPRSGSRGRRQRGPLPLLQGLGAHQAGLVALPVAVLDGVALVGHLLAASEAELHLGDAAIVEIDRHRHEG